MLNPELTVQSGPHGLCSATVSVSCDIPTETLLGGQEASLCHRGPPAFMFLLQPAGPPGPPRVAAPGLLAKGPPGVPGDHRWVGCDFICLTTGWPADAGGLTCLWLHCVLCQGAGDSQGAHGSWEAVRGGGWPTSSVWSPAAPTLQGRGCGEARKLLESISTPALACECPWAWLCARGSPTDLAGVCRDRCVRIVTGVPSDRCIYTVTDVCAGAGVRRCARGGRCVCVQRQVCAVTDVTCARRQVCVPSDRCVRMVTGVHAGAGVCSGAGVCAGVCAVTGVCVQWPVIPLLSLGPGGREAAGVEGREAHLCFAGQVD